jgi:hypothetical protein
MPQDIKLTGPSMEERIANRLKNSGAGAKPDITNKTGDGPNPSSSQHPQLRE